jgi:hypothetical protein
MNKMFFVIVFFAGCILFTFCNKDLPVKTYVYTPPPPPPPPFHTPIPDSVGRVKFWTNFSEPWWNYDAVGVVIKSTPTGIISGYGSAEYNPYLLSNCLQAHGSRFDLPPGEYTWEASWEQYFTSGKITITARTCVLQEIFF